MARRVYRERYSSIETLPPYTEAFTQPYTTPSRSTLPPPYDGVVPTQPARAHTHHRR
ncbi:hypothetical protein B0H67DRAFT_572969 [Lasiosphaeris hirsuta]|uniref:Uncharacterized protein n=1 Tax=Lasiosphaeris hirsuta TaxID=260670 RepID=A0AA40DWW1_9PEZI|nr:hypothetical protein B0H67DRAFT_572969 [Lasiosphaeris hirsuta]